MRLRSHEQRNIDCAWFDGWSQSRVKRALGPTERSRGHTLSWILGDDPDAIGPTLVLLEITFDAHDRVVDTQIGSRPYWTRLHAVSARASRRSATRAMREAGRIARGGPPER